MWSGDGGDAYELALVLVPRACPLRGARNYHSPVDHIDRPLKLGELFAETVRLYGERFGSFLGTGGVVCASLPLVIILPAAAAIAVFAIVLTGAFAASARIAAGDSFREAWSQVGVRATLLLPLAFVVGLPFALAIGDPIVLKIVLVFWLAFVGFSVPVAMLEPADAEGWLARVGGTLRRSVALARAEYLHAAGVAAGLVLAYTLFGIVLAVALVGFADNTEQAAWVLVQLVLLPFVLAGLSVLYFEQKARALSSSRRKATASG